MPYLKSSQITGLSPKPIDVTGFTQSASEDLEGTYSQHEVLLADAFNVTDNVTISDNLILAKLSDDGNAITVTGNASTTRTIAGSGSLEGSTFAQTPNASLTGMTGVIGSAITGRGITSGTITSGVTFPAGHVIQVLTGTNSSEAYTQSTSFVSISLTVTITPKSASSKFFIICNTSGYNNEGSNQVGYYTIYRDSTNLGTGAGYADIYQGSGAGHDIGTNICISELDSPSTTSAVTYGMYAKTNNTSYKTYWSMNGSKSDITVMEVAG